VIERTVTVGDVTTVTRAEGRSVKECRRAFEMAEHVFRKADKRAKKLE
jgi:hypothetical protein